SIRSGTSRISIVACRFVPDSCRRIASFCKAGRLRISSTTASAGRPFSPRISPLEGRPIRSPLLAFAFASGPPRALQAAVFSGDPSGGNGSNQVAPLPTGTVVSFRGGAFFIAEASYLPNQGKDAKGLPGAYRIGAWYHTSPRFADQRFDNTGLSLAN